MCFVADGIGKFVIGHRQLGGVGHKLAGDRVVGIGRIDKGGEADRDGDAVFRADSVQRRNARFFCETCFGEVCAGTEYRRLNAGGRQDV